MATWSSPSVVNGAWPLTSFQGGAALGSQPQWSPLSVPFNHLVVPGGGGGVWLDTQKLGKTTNLSPLCTWMLKVSWTRRQIWRISYMKKTSTFAASRRHTFSPANPSKWEAISASGQTEQTDTKEEYWLLSKQHQRLSDRHSQGRYEYQVLKIQAGAQDIQLTPTAPTTSLYLLIPSTQKSPALSQLVTLMATHGAGDISKRTEKVKRRTGKVRTIRCWSIAPQTSPPSTPNDGKPYPLQTLLSAPKICMGASEVRKESNWVEVTRPLACVSETASWSQHRSYLSMVELQEGQLDFLVPKKANSHQTVSLTSCVVKTMEKIANEHQNWYLETDDLLVPEQAGFWQFYSTEDQATYLFQEEWHYQQQSNWIKSYLYNCRARVYVDRCHSKNILLSHGVQQGGVLSPPLLLLFINDLV